MKIAGIAGVATLAALIAPTLARGQAPAQLPASASAPATIESINAEYERELLQVERHRIESLGRLALAQAGEPANATFEALFRLAIARNLYADALPYAARVIQSPGTGPGVAWLAHLVQIVGEAERGDYEGSLKSLASALRVKGEDPAGAAAGARAAGLSPAALASIVDAYYQRLIHADQVEVARKAMRLVRDGAGAPAVRDLASRRLRQLEMVGQPAPKLAGLDLDGKAFKLADHKGEVVLVVFWATWCQPNAREMPWLDYIGRTYQAKGFRVVGVNLDSAQDGGQEIKSVLPAIRRQLLEHNITWPTLLNGPGEADYAAAFGVTEIPASVLIGRDGKVSHLDLSGRKLERAVAEAVAQKP